jgi:DNA-binding response OmpR family regulator
LTRINHDIQLKIAFKSEQMGSNFFFFGNTVQGGGGIMQSILIIEDDKLIVRILETELIEEGYKVEVAFDGRNGLEKALHGTWNLILLDIVLPELNGMEVLRRVKKSAPAIPVIVITGRSETTDIVSGLDQGAYDYITKPFELEELLARIRACLRHQKIFPHANAGDSVILSINGLTVNLKTREVQREGQNIELTMKEYDLLVFLMENEPHVVSREEIIQQVWGYDFVGDTNIVDVYIRYLRKKVDYGFSGPLIQTIRGVGYCIRETDSEA